MRFALYLAALVLLLSSCDFMFRKKVRGNGTIATRVISTGNFNEVEARGSMNVRVRKGSTTEVKVEVDENLFEHLDIRVDGETLVVTTKRNVNIAPSRDMVVYVTAPDFERVAASGSGDLMTENLLSFDHPLTLQTSGSGNIQAEVDVPELTTKTSGSGNVSLRGTAEDFEASVSGSGEVHAADLRAQNAKLRISGSGDADIFAEKALEVRVSGSGTVRYKGEPKTDIKTSGSGSVSKM